MPTARYSMLICFLINFGAGENLKRSLLSPESITGKNSQRPFHMTDKKVFVECVHFVQKE